MRAADEEHPAAIAAGCVIASGEGFILSRPDGRA